MIMRPSEALAAHQAELRELASRHGLEHPRVFGSVLTGTDDGIIETLAVAFLA
jgi:hypothetical protein